MSGGRGQVGDLNCYFTVGTIHSYNQVLLDTQIGNIHSHSWVEVCMWCFQFSTGDQFKGIFQYSRKSFFAANLLFEVDTKLVLSRPYTMGWRKEISIIPPSTQTGEFFLSSNCLLPVGWGSHPCWEKKLETSAVGGCTKTILARAVGVHKRSLGVPIFWSQQVSSQGNFRTFWKICWQPTLCLKWTTS